MATKRALGAAWPLGSEVDERGRLHVGGADLLELAAEVGTPAYVVAEDDLRARARMFRDAFAQRAGEDASHVVFAAKAFPATAVLRVFAEEGLGCDVASGGELALALRAGFAPDKVHLHGNAKSEAEIAAALEAGIGHVVIDNFVELERLERMAAERRPGQPVLIRVTPGVRGDTHDFISTGQADSKFGFSMADAREAVARLERSAALDLEGVHMHIGSQLLDLQPFRDAAEVAASLGRFRVVNLGGGLGVTYTNEEPPDVDRYVAAKVDAVREHFGPEAHLVDEPGRALVANAGVTIYRVESVKRNASTWVAVDGGMSDNLRPMLYGARYQAHVADRPGGETPCHLVGKHCESSDVIVRDAVLDDPRPGDVVVTPATGAYGYAMANNYNGIPRPPVVFVSGGRWRTVVRRETVDDLFARDV